MVLVEFQVADAEGGIVARIAAAVLMTSSTIKSGRSDSASRSASPPVAPVVTAQPWNLSATWTSSRMLGSSSTTSTLGTCSSSLMASHGLLSPYRAGDRGGRASARQPASAWPSAVDGGASVNGQISSEIPRQSAVADIRPRMAKSPRLIRCTIT